jgi:hypothetical protein
MSPLEIASTIKKQLENSESLNEDLIKEKLEIPSLI